MKIHTDINNPISASNARESPKFARLIGNRGRGTRQWRQISDRKWNVTRILFQHDYRNRSVIVDSVMGQIPRSTERVSSSFNSLSKKWHRFSSTLRQSLLA